MISKLASAIYNDVKAGLSGMSGNVSMSLEQLEDDVTDERLQIIKEYSMKGILPKNDLLVSINCIDTDCKSLDKCPCGVLGCSDPELHFELPQIVNDFSLESIDYIGATDKSRGYKVYTNPKTAKYHKYKRRGSELPYVYIDITPNENNLLDAWVFNAPFTKRLSAMIIPKDLRQLDFFGCCSDEELDNKSFIYTEVKKRLTEKKLRYYRQFLAQPQPNNQVAR